MLVVILVDYEEIEVVTDGFQQFVGDKKYVMCNTCTHCCRAFRYPGTLRRKLAVPLL